MVVSRSSVLTLLVRWTWIESSAAQFAESGPSPEARVESESCISRVESESKSECVGLESKSNKIGIRVRLESVSKDSSPHLWLPLLSRCCTTSSILTLLKFSQDTLLHDRFDLLLSLPSLCLWGKPQWYFQNHFPQLHPTFGRNYPVICQLSQLSRLLVNISSTTFFSRPTMALSRQPPRLLSPCNIMPST